MSVAAHPTIVQNGSFIDFTVNLTRGNDVDYTLKFLGESSMSDITRRVEWAHPYYMHNVSVK